MTIIFIRIAKKEDATEVAELLPNIPNTFFIVTDKKIVSLKSCQS